MSYKPRAKFETIKTLASGGIGAAYALIGTLQHSTRWVLIQNLTDAAMYFSQDGVNNHFALPSNAFLVIDLNANKRKDDGFELRQNDNFYVKQYSGAATTGNVHISSLYAE